MISAQSRILLRRIKAYYLSAFAFVILSFGGVLMLMYPYLPLPAGMAYLCVLPFLLLALASGVYPARGLSIALARKRFLLQLFSVVALCLSPFGVWYAHVPDRHFFELCFLASILALIVVFALWCDMAGCVAPPHSYRRYGANALAIFGKIFTVGTIGLFITTAILPGFLRMIPSAVLISAEGVLIVGAIAYAILAFVWPFSSTDFIAHTHVDPWDPEATHE